MKTENKIYRIIIVLLAIANIYLIFKQKHFFSEKAAVVQEESTNKNNIPTLFNELYEKAIESNGYPINKNIEFIDYKGKNIKLSELLKQHCILAFDFTHINCKTCFEHELERITKLSTEFGKENIILISKFKSKREQYVIENKYGLKVLNKGNYEFGLPIESGYYPFVFIIDTNYIASDFYIPTEQFFSLGNIYYNILLNKYFKKDKELLNGEISK